MSGWHIRPKGVKKPYNPVLGEYFRCKWQVDGTTSYYISEQVLSVLEDRRSNNNNNDKHQHQKKKNRTKEKKDIKEPWKKKKLTFSMHFLCVCVCVSQVSHHPPVSAYYFANPQKGVFIQGFLAPRSVILFFFLSFLFFFFLFNLFFFSFLFSVLSFLFFFFSLFFSVVCFCVV